MSRGMKHGTCNICGVVGPLTYEHVPPESAGNDAKVIRTDADSYWNRGPGRGLDARGWQFQGGYGGHSLCQQCNNDTGRWYAPYFIDWCKQGRIIRDSTRGAPALHYLSPMFPLPVIKQIVTMFLARNGDRLGAAESVPLVRFVLNREQRYLDPKFRFWVYLVAPGPLRDTPPCATYSLDTGRHTFGMEFSFPPYGYMMTIDSRPDDPRLCEVSWFTRYGYFDMAQVSVRLELLATHTPVLGDYRALKDLNWEGDLPRVFTKFGIKGVDS